MIGRYSDAFFVDRSGFFFVALALFAQSDSGTITGTIIDPAGAVVANAAIEARKTETGAVYQVASSATGNYTMPNCLRAL